MILMDDLRRHVGKFYGKYSGTVTGNEDTEHLGRIMVQVPSIFGTQVSVQARPCLPFGHFYVPAPGTRVWIEFEAGDRSYPLWVGTWLPPGTTPPEAAVSPPDSRVIKTPSGHTIELHDQAGEEKIIIKHKLGSFLSVDKEGSVVISNQRGSHLHLNAKEKDATLMEEHGNLLTMNADGTVIVSKDGVTLELKKDLARLIAKEIVLQGTTVAAGAGAAEPTLLGQTFMAMWNLFIMHTHPSAMGPTGTPIPPGQPLSPTMGLTNALVVK